MKKAQYFIGIDLHKTVIQVCVVNMGGDVHKEFRQRLDEPEAETEMRQRLRRWKANGQYVVEAQGLNRWFVNACQASGLRILVANPTTLTLKRSGKKQRQVSNQTHVSSSDPDATLVSRPVSTGNSITKCTTPPMQRVA
jgi:transposase